MTAFALGLRKQGRLVLRHGLTRAEGAGRCHQPGMMLLSEFRWRAILLQKALRPSWKSTGRVDVIQDMPGSSSRARSGCRSASSNFEAVAQRAFEHTSCGRARSEPLEGPFVCR
jgi:hypothetical protein